MSNFTILYSFDSSASGNGANPTGTLLMDAAGNLFGTESTGGPGGTYGGVFELAAGGNGYASNITVLAKFNFSNGSGVDPDLVMDADGNLFGETSNGGPTGNGEVFELVKTSTGYTQTVLYGFTSSTGTTPFDSGLTIDAAGNLFGVTTAGGANGAGTVFEMAKTGSGYAAPTALASLGANHDSSKPYDSHLIMDAAGNLFGTTELGGPNGYGTVYEIAKTATGYASTQTILYNFDKTNGRWPLSSLIMDADGNLFGTTSGGGANDQGTVFEIAKTASGYASTPTVLVSFNAASGIEPYGSLVMDAAGNIYGTTIDGGPTSNDHGTVFEIAKINGVYASTPTTLAIFDGTNGSYPWGGLIMDASGAIYGTTSRGGANGAGTIFKLTPPTPLAVAVGGTAQEGQTLAANPNQDVDSYQWQVLINGSWNNITGATGATYLVQAVDDGRQIRVSTTNGAGFTATSAATNAVLDAAGNQPVYESANQSTIGSGQFQWIYGHATNTAVGSGGAQNVYASGSATVTTLNAGSVQEDWGAASTTTISGGQQYVFGTADITIINSGQQVVESGGAASSTTLHGGEQIVYGGTVTGTDVQGGSQTVYGTANQTTIGNGAIQNLHGSGSATTLNNGGLQNVYADGTATGTTLNAGSLQIDWGAASGTAINGGTQDVYGTATDTTVSSGVQHVEAGGAAVNTSIGLGSLAWVHAGGSMDGVTFAGQYAVLGLDQSSALTGSISGWQANDSIDLGDVVFSDGVTSLAYAQSGDNSGGALTVSDGTHVATLNLLGQYSAADFALSSDGHGGTLVSDPAVAPLAQLAPALRG